MAVDLTLTEGEEGQHKRQTFVRCYDQELVKIVSSGLIYLLSGKGRVDLTRDEELANKYRQEPNKAAWDELLPRVKLLKNPLHSENTLDFTHGLFVCLQQVYQGTLSGMKMPGDVTPQQVEDAFRGWMKHVCHDLQVFSEGTTHVSDKDPNS